MQTSDCALPHATIAPHEPAQALVTVSGMTLLSRILGFIAGLRHRPHLAPAWMTDAFFVAFKLPNPASAVCRRGISQASFPFSANTATSAANRKQSDWSTTSATLLFLDPCSSSGGIRCRSRPNRRLYLSAPGFAADAGKFERR